MARCFFLLTILVLARAAQAAPALELHVAPAGADTNSGTLDRPFATLERARDELRRLRADRKVPNLPVTIWLRGGEHPRTRSFELEARDGGTVATPVAYRAWPGETPRLVAGLRLNAETFRTVSDSRVMERLPQAARGKVVALDLAALGVRHTGPWPDLFSGQGGLVELIVDGQRLPLARWPNEGPTTMKRVLFVGNWSNGPTRRGGVFEYRDDRHARWPVDQGVWLTGFWRVPWQSETVRVGAIDPKARTVTFAAPVSAGIGSKFDRPHGSGAEPYWVVNLLEELDRPGEWAVDFARKTLYLWPPAPLAKTRVLLSDMSEPVISLRGASRVSLRGLLLEGGLGDGVRIEGGVDNLVSGCEIRHLGGNAVVIEGGTRHTVAGCELHHLGAGGVIASGGDRKTLEPAGHQIVNNHIHHYGEVVKVYAAAVNVGYDKRKSAVGIRIAHNLIHDAPHVGVLYGGNDNLLEYNRIFRVCLVSDDMGAFYTTNDWTSRGNVVRYNFVHHSPRAHGVYCDDGDSGDRIYGNVLQGVDGGVYLGGGRDNVVTGNLLLQCRRGLHVDARGVARNYTTKNEGMTGRVRDVSPDRPPWSDRYPELASLLTTSPELPGGTVFDSNLCVRCNQGLERRGSDSELRDVTFGPLLETKADLGLNVARPLRVKIPAAMRKDLPRWQEIPTERIGPYLDEHRTKLPRLPSVQEIQRDLPAPVPVRHWQGG